MELDRVVQMGLDCHKRFSTAVGRGGEGQVVWRQRLEHEDRRHLRGALRDWPQGLPVVLEGTFGWGWMSDELRAAGLQPHLASSRKVAAWRDARGMAKSNRTDAELLSELWDQQPRWWEVWLPPRAVQDQREWLRYRMALVQVQTGLKNRIHAVLHRHGIVHPFSDLFGVRGRSYLQELVLDVQAPLSNSGRAVLKGYLQMLDQARRRIAEATREIRRQVRRDPAAERLRTLPGVNYILAYTILAEVGRIERFPSAKHLASYSLLAPRAWDSGDDDGTAPKGRHVGHAGRRTLKWAWIEAAHTAVRRDRRFGEPFARRTENGQRNTGQGYIAAAHELCHVAYVLWSKEQTYQKEPPARSGSKSQGPREEVNEPGGAAKKESSGKMKVLKRGKVFLRGFDAGRERLVR